MQEVESVKKRIIIEGKKIHQVGYRPFLLRMAMRFRIPNFEAENVKENGRQKIIISMIGEEKQISDFLKFAREESPKFAKDCKVSEEKSLPEEVLPIDEYQKSLNAEQQDKMVQGGLEIGKKIDTLKKETTQNFNKMDEKYDAISKGMFAIVERLERRDETFERRIEKTEKNIESLLKILAEKKS